ncbi:MAG: hypothetical protein AAGI91_13765 [Bacteroidota bacterium]
MPRTYEGTLTGDRIDWHRDAPPERGPLPVRVTVLGDEQSAAERGQRMAGALRRLAASEAFREIEDPAAWQRDIRTDRPLPGREG